MSTLANQDHNDIISLAVKIQEILKAGGERRVFKFRVRTTDSTTTKLIVWNASSAVNIEWQQGEWYQLQDALLKKWASNLELNATNNTTAEKIDRPNSDSERQDVTKEVESASTQTDDITSLVHTTNSYLDRKNMGRRSRQDDYLSVFEETIDYAQRITADAVVHTGNLFWSQSPSQRVIERTKEILQRAANSNIDFYLLYGKRDLKVRDIISELIDAGLIIRLDPRWNQIGNVAIFAHDATVNDPELGFHYPPNDSASRLAAVHDDIPTATEYTDIKAFETEIGWSLDGIILGNQNERTETIKQGVKILSPGPPERAIGKKYIDIGSLSQRYVHRYDISSTGISVQAYETSPRPVAGFRLRLGPKESLADIRKILPMQELSGAAAIFEVTGKKGEKSPSKDEIQQLVGEQAVVARAYDERVREVSLSDTGGQSSNENTPAIIGLNAEQGDHENNNTPIKPQRNQSADSDQETESERPLTDIPGIGETRAESLSNAGFNSPSEVADATINDLKSQTKISGEIAKSIRLAAREVRGDDRTELTRLAEDCEVDRADVADAYADLVYHLSGTFDKKIEAIYDMFSNEKSILSLEEASMTHLYSLYLSGFHEIQDVAQASTSDLAEAPYITHDRAETIQATTRELSNYTELTGPKFKTTENEDGLPPIEDWDADVLASATTLDSYQIQSSIDQLMSEGCSRDKALAYMKRYLKEMLQGEGLFAVSGVGPNSGYKLTQAGISTIDELQRGDPDEIARLTDLSAERVQRLQTAAVSGDLRSLDPDDKEVASELLESESTRPTDTLLGTQDSGNTNQDSSDATSNATDGISSNSNSNVGSADEVETGSESIITRSEGKKLLQSSVGSDAEFRPQQWQAIDTLANKKEQLLLVQRTGWGKSTVYFIATYALREQGAGPTLIISPLLSLMRDQIKNAEEELGLSATTINSSNKEEWGQIYENIIEGEYDVVLISPERLKNQEFREQALSEIADGFQMLVVDEAHCISDWGHDFRPDYQRVTRILERLPSNVPVAATTATANDRVIKDITTQLPGLRLIRGDLVRESLQIQAINIGSRQKRLAWLAENLPEGPRAGIIYCLTIDDVQRVTEWLQKHGYDVESYYGSVDNEKQQKREQLLLNNEVDALVATNALGMGFDKPDLKFVFHFQRPPNIIRYYQEIGRAGRDLDQAHAVVLSGPDDDDTAEYFIESAFPSANNFEAILSAIKDADEPLTQWDIRKQSNASNVKQCLKMLRVEGAIKRMNDGFVRTANKWSYDADKYERITEQRYEELDRIQTFMRTDRCLTLFIDQELDGKMTEPCGRCASCSRDFYPRRVQNEALIQRAVKHYQESGISTIDNRVYRYGEDGTRQKMPMEDQLETGRSLAVYDEPGWGTKVREGKYEIGRFDDALVRGAAELIEEEWDPSPAPQWITFVPSESTEGLIAGFARRLADKLDLELIDCVGKTGDTKPQKELSGSFEKCANVRNAFSVTRAVRGEPVLLIDDIVQSRWTLTEVGRQLSQAGSGNVYPFALARRRG